MPHGGRQLHGWGCCWFGAHRRRLCQDRDQKLGIYDSYILTLKLRRHARWQAKHTPQNGPLDINGPLIYPCLGPNAELLDLIDRAGHGCMNASPFSGPHEPRRKGYPETGPITLFQSRSYGPLARINHYKTIIKQLLNKSYQRFRDL